MIELLTPATVGQVFSVVGIIFLANSMGIRNPRRFLNEHFGVEQVQPLKAVHQQIRVKAQIFTGFLFLLVGFSLGIVAGVVGPSGPDEPATKGVIVRSLMVAAAVVVVLSLLLRLAQDAWSRRVFRRMLSEFFQEHTSWNFEKHPNTLREIGEILGVQRREEDSIGDYADRLRAVLGLTHVPANGGGRGDDAFAPLRRLGTERRP